MTQLSQTTLLFGALLLMFGVLFLLQIWAILRIKEMLQQVTEILRFVKASTRVVRRLPAPQKHMQAVCENCKFRSTFLSNEKPPRFLYKCKKNNSEIELTHTCRLFKLDPQSKET